MTVIDKIKAITDELDKEHVDYVGMRDKRLYGDKHKKEYETLYKTVVIDIIFKHFDIDLDDDGVTENNWDIYFDRFENDHDRCGWYGEFWKPNVTFYFDKVLNGDFSELKKLDDYVNTPIEYC